MTELIIAIVSLIALSIIRFISKDKNRLLWNSACLINLIAIGYLALNSYRKGVKVDQYIDRVDSLKENTISKSFYKLEKDSIDKLLNEKEMQINKIRSQTKYGPISKLNIFGSERSISSGLPGSEIELYKRMMRIVDQNNQPYPLSTLESKKMIDEVIDLYPDFPFAYFHKAYIERKENRTWKKNAIKAIEILEITSSYDNHKNDHDEVLLIINKWMN